MKCFLRLIIATLLTQGLFFGCKTTGSGEFERIEDEIAEPTYIGNYKIRLRDGLTTLSWDSENGRAYAVAYCDKVLEPNGKGKISDSDWRILNRRVLGTGDVISVSDRVPQRANRMYRVQVLN